MTKQKLAVIHCGFHKTGSSTIQHTLAKNRKLLAENGWTYPEIKVEGKTFFNQSIPLYGVYCKHPENFRQYWYHNKLSHETANAKIYSKLTESVWQQPRLIFSDEFIAGLDLKGLSKLKSDFQKNGYAIRVISFVREPLDLMRSKIQQKVRTGSSDALFESLDPFRELEKIKNLIAVFGADAEFHNFEKACGHSAGPAGFFFELIGMTLEPDRTIRVNESMSLQAARLLSFINSKAPLFLGASSIHPLRTRFDADFLIKLPGEKFRMSAEQISKIRPAAQQARCEIEKLLGNDFFSPEAPQPEPVFVWGNEQFDFLHEVFDELDLYMLIRTCDFLLELNKSAQLDDGQMNTLLARVRNRVDEEKRRVSERKEVTVEKAVGILKRIKRKLQQFKLKMKP